MGLYANLDLLQAKVACDRWDMMVLVETWMRDLPGDLIRHPRTHLYTAHHLPATMSCVLATRNCHGILILIRDCWHVHSMEQRRCDFGEYIQLHICGLFHVVALYRAAHNMTWAYDRTLSLFQDATLPTPTLWIGNYNW